ncbi:hypothetical protein FQN53_003876 [Emmonsiellopsis sp. PD_33]|nr:hypothetical protein FQN53_003876 [Emmonsiellopsis sp. PD_33]
MAQSTDLELEKIWKIILRPGAAQDEQYVNKYYNWRRAPSIQALLGQPRSWMSWSYKAAYPKLASLLEKTSLDSKFRSRVILEEFEMIRSDRSQNRKLSYNEAHASLSIIFDALKTLPTQAADAKCFEQQLNGRVHVKRLTRVLHIMDISPLVLNCLFGTTSSLSISHLVAFIDRNLNGLNWARVNLRQMQHMNWCSYIYEYHFSFYYVTLDYFDPDSVKPDMRHVRKSCPFGQAKNTKHRYIHEETVSFLLCGYFDDTFACYQLGDAYYQPRYAKNQIPRVFRSYDPNQSPGQFLLYWIAVALFHGRSRWENAIDLLDSEIKSPADVVFMEDRSDLMADDPQFSLSKTYFWALQTYKLFERTLEETIATWENFKKYSLPKIQDGSISAEDWDAGVGSIDQAIDCLKPKIERIRRSIQDVKDLREGLQSTAAVFDSRIAVRQGENIRLLTYITLLFLPLSFGTGIFSMQIIEPNPTTINAFAIAFPIITIVSALLIFNLNNLTTAFDTVVRNTTSTLLKKMKLHSRSDWKSRAQALQQDNIMAEPPVRKASKQSSHWVYMLFLIEAALVLLPVSELKAALRCYGLFDSESDSDSDPDDYDSEGEADTEKPRNERKKEVQRRVKRTARQAKEQERRNLERENGALWAISNRIYQSSVYLVHGLIWTIFTLLRAILLPVWIILLLVEYILLSTTLLLTQDGHHIPKSNTPQPHKHTSSLSLSPFHQASKILCLNTLTPPNLRHHLRAHFHPHPPSLPTTTFFSPEEPPKPLPPNTSPSQPQNKENTPSTTHTAIRPPSSPSAPTPTPIEQPPPARAQFELSVFPRQPQSSSDTRARSPIRTRFARASNFARYGGGVVMGDFVEAEEDPGAEAGTKREKGKGGRRE